MADSDPTFNVVFSTTLLERLAHETPAGRERREQKRRSEEERRRQQEANTHAAQRPRHRDPEAPIPSEGGQRQEGRHTPHAAPLGLPGAMPNVPAFLHRARPARHDAEEPFPANLAPIKQALAESEAVGALLLKREEDELHKVKERASRLHAQEYRAPSHSPPCYAQREECRQCYSDNKQDPLICASKVRAFTECSREAQQAFVAGGSRTQSAQQ